MIFLTKSIMALVLVALAVVNFIVILELLGRTGEKRFNPKRLRLIHRINGYVIFVLFIVLSYLCIIIMRGMDGPLPARAALHGLLASAAFFLLCVKIIIVKYYKKYYAMAVPMGIGVFLLILMTTPTSAGYYFVMRGTSSNKITESVAEGVAREGALVFINNGCADCHYTDKTQMKVGAGLKGLFLMEKLASSGWPVTEENVKKQILKPAKAMPAYPNLTEKDLQALITFMKSL